MIYNMFIYIINLLDAKQPMRFVRKQAIKSDWFFLMKLICSGANIIWLA